MKQIFSDPRELELIERVSLLLNEKGLKNMTMDDIAKHLHVSKKTLYKYVKNRSQLVTKCITVRVTKQREFREMIASQGYNAIEEYLKILEITSSVLSKTNKSLHSDLQNYYKEAWLVFVDFRENFLMQSIVKNIKKGQQEGLFCSKINVNIIAKMYIAKIDIVFDGKTFPEEDYDFTHILQTIVFHHIRGIATRKGIDELERLSGITFN